jgi:hypothetical protein
MCIRQNYLIRFFYEYDNINDELEKIDDRIDCSPKRQRSLLIIDELYMYKKKTIHQFECYHLLLDIA